MDFPRAGERYTNGGPLNRSIVDTRYKMADLPPHREDRMSGSRFPSVCASWDTTAPSIPQGSLSSGPPRHCAGVQQNTVVSDKHRGALLIDVYQRSVY